jgi:RNA polymerase sigma-70 factor (ECF subfamily)
VDPQPRSLAASSAPRPPGGDDVALVRRAVSSADREAIEEVLARLACVPRMVHRLDRTLGHGLPTDALEDVVQQVYAAIWPRLGAFHGGASLESWAFGFCRNCLRAEARRRANRVRLLPGVGQDGFEGLGEWVPAVEPEPEAGALDRERLELLQRELARLPAEERQVVELRFVEDWSYERIARELALAASTVKDRCYRALSKLKEGLRRRDVEA